MKNILQRVLVVLTSAGLYACVTVNVYFPAAAVEQAADRIVKEVYGAKLKEIEEREQAPQSDTVPENDKSGALAPARTIGTLLNALVPPAYAQQPDIDIDTPTINQLKAAMQARHQQLVPYYNAGAVGLAATGLLTLRDPQAVSLKERARVQQLLGAENRDRNALYAEIASANGHPEWEPQIRTIFDRRWVGNAPGGWWFQDASGNWVQK
ncbi:MAG: YdbL family protein [Chromatiales bacterium]